MRCIPMVCNGHLGPPPAFWQGMPLQPEDGRLNLGRMLHRSLPACQRCKSKFKMSPKWQPAIDLTWRVCPHASTHIILPVYITFLRNWMHIQTCEIFSRSLDRDIQYNIYIYIYRNHWGWGDQRTTHQMTLRMDKDKDEPLTGARDATFKHYCSCYPGGKPTYNLKLAKQETWWNIETWSVFFQTAIIIMLRC